MFDNNARTHQTLLEPPVKKDANLLTKMFKSFQKEIVEEINRNLDNQVSNLSSQLNEYNKK